MVVLPRVMVESPMEVVVTPRVIEDLPMVIEVLPRAIEEPPKDRAVLPSVMLVFPMKAWMVPGSRDAASPVSVSLFLHFGCVGVG